MTKREIRRSMITTQEPGLRKGYRLSFAEKGIMFESDPSGMFYGAFTPPDSISWTFIGRPAKDRDDFVNRVFNHLNNQTDVYRI